jgi:predicted nucleotidyltransferase
VEPEIEFREFLDLNAQIELELGIPVDLVEIAEASASLRASVIENGIKLKETN